MRSDVFAFAPGKVVVAHPAWVHWAPARTDRETRVDAPTPHVGARRVIRDAEEAPSDLTAAGLLVDRTVTTRPGPPRRRRGVITGPKRFRAVAGRRA